MGSDAHVNIQAVRVSHTSSATIATTTGQHVSTSKTQNFFGVLSKKLDQFRFVFPETFHKIVLDEIQLETYEH